MCEMVTLHSNLPLPDNVATCSLLLSHGADPNSKDSDGMTGACLEVQLSSHCHCSNKWYLKTCFFNAGGYDVL